MRFRASDLRPHGWAPPQTLHIPDWCGCTTDGPRITFRTIPARLHAWLRRIDRWIAYANSVVEE